MTPCGTKINRNTWCGDRDDDPETNVYSQNLCPECEEENNRLKRLDDEMTEILARELAEVF